MLVSAGSVGTFAVILLAVAQRGMGLRGFVTSLTESLRTACMVLMLIAGSTVLSHFPRSGQGHPTPRTGWPAHRWMR
jgi:TRAP-type C4-dicarboxylate transport system permease large subunit